MSATLPRMACLLVPCLLVLACGGGEPTPSPDAAGADFCAARACSTTVETVDDWAALAVPSANLERCDLVEVSKFLAPAGDDAPLPTALVIDVHARPLHLDFLRQEVPDVFGGLTEASYQALVQARATRRLWAGALYRLTDDAGAPAGYGFDLIVAPQQYDELPTEAEVAEVQAALTDVFHLPLVYAPTGPDAIGAAYGYQGVDVWWPRSCTAAACSNPAASCITVPTAVTTCGVFWEGRTIEEEYAQKAQLDLVAGEVDLPTSVGTHAVTPIFGAGLYGPDRRPIAPTGAASLVVSALGDTTQGTYHQAFTVDGLPYALTWDLGEVAAGRGPALAEPWLAGGLYAIFGPDAVGDVPLTLLSSCTAPLHDDWRLDVTFAGGGHLQLDTRFVQPNAGSGPLRVLRGEVTLDGTTTIVDDYFQLVYAGLHHNWDNTYWILFDAPVTYQGHAIAGVELADLPNLNTAGTAATLDADLAPLDALTITTFAYAPTP